ncbi:hypothetical protein KGF57_000045 [Candida theae]|uniref:ferric-chelate reductase (NADPH) n=1 Tax=Candida theae TaxID=1198502 RepID=A0AAD5BJQ6_9ASCO|nr:uncharacterized protein KGF57_000045 [Candida theae]KAI5968930.1 hypothetical protein KGF57_000045 [Candida theae]
MHTLAYLACFLLGFVSLATASLDPYEKLGKKRIFYACTNQIQSEVSFCPPKEISCQCVNENYMATIAGCLRRVNEDLNFTINFMHENCVYYNVTVADDWYDGAIKLYDEKAKSASEIPNFNMSIPIDVPFILNTTMTGMYQEAFKRFYENYDTSIEYGSGMLGYWLLVLILGAIFNWVKILFPNITKKMTHPVINWWRQYVSMPATFRKKKSQEQNFLRYFGFLIPSRLESLVIFLFYCVTIWLHAMNSKAIDNDPVFESKYKAELRYVSDRSGITATLMMPLVFLYAGRNNFLQWLVQWDYSTFMAYHRHTARVMFALAVIHSVGYTILLYDDYAEEAAETYFYWGIIATTVGGLIMIQAFFYLRRKWYEIFLFFHIVLAAVWVAGVWLHVTDLGFIWLVYPAVAVWCFDRVVRIGRLIAFGFPHAEVTLLADETLKVVVPKPSYWHSIPGGHAFVHFIRPTYFWQSHPFTFTESTNNEDSIVLYCKVKGGITHSLYQLLVKAPGRTCKIRVSCEGPYGEPTPARYSDTAVFIAGGNGIPGLYSEVVDIAEKTPISDNKLKLIWVVREWRSIYWFYEELLHLKNTKIETIVYISQPKCYTFIDEFNNRFVGLEGLESEESNELKTGLNTEDVKIEEFSTEETQSSTDKMVRIDEPIRESDGSYHKIVDIIKSELSHVKFIEGRPSIEELIPSEIHESNGSISFVTCGHPAMVDQVRYYCAKNVSNKEKKRVDFYEQIQVWA